MMLSTVKSNRVAFDDKAPFEIAALPLKILAGLKRRIKKIWLSFCVAGILQFMTFVIFTTSGFCEYYIVRA